MDGAESKAAYMSFLRIDLVPHSHRAMRHSGERWLYSVVDLLMLEAYNF